MKYSDLICFKPIESTIQLLETAEKSEAQNVVSTYVMSDSMADNLRFAVIDQLQMEEMVDNKAVMVVGNFGTGKSHLMSLIAAVAADAEHLELLQNRKFAENMKVIAGRFEVLRMKIDGITMPLREIVLGEIEEDFQNRGIDYQAPNLDSVRDNARIIKEAMLKFQKQYPNKGYLIVIDELLSYLTSRDERQIVLDLAFLQSMAEMCSKSRLRVICGVQEKVFDNPRFSFVSDTLKKVGDRFTQIVITKEATAYVVSERILKKDAEQKAWIRAHLEKFTSLYGGMASRLEEFVDLFPIHPAYIDVFNKIQAVENRHLLKNISLCIRGIFHADVPESAPGMISFDDYWPAIKNNGMMRSDPEVAPVVNASQQLEDIINRAFPKPVYKPLAIQIIYALSVHRLTTGGLQVPFGLTAENLKDDLCLYLPLPEQDATFLRAVIQTTLRDIMTTVSGQFVVCNENNSQYYIDVEKVIDYDEKIRQKADIMADSELNRYFYDVIYSCLEWDAKEYVSNFRIYQYDLNWDSHHIFRAGYLFMGPPEERSTAQPERDFYLYIMPPYGSGSAGENGLPDEAYLYFKSSEEFQEKLEFFAAAQSLATGSQGKDRTVYESKAANQKKFLTRYLNEKRNTCFDLSCKHRKYPMTELLRGRYNRDMTFRETVDLAVSILLDGYFSGKYKDFPVMNTRITRANLGECVREARDYFAGRKSKLAVQMVSSFGLLDGDKIRPEGSPYAMYYIDLLRKLPPRGVLNFSDLFDVGTEGEYFDKRFQISYLYMPVVFLALVYAGYAVITLENGKIVSASSLDQLPKDPAMATMNLSKFKYLSRPSQLAVAELKKLFEVLDINPALLDNPNDREKGVRELLREAQAASNAAVSASVKLADDFTLWGEPLVGAAEIARLQAACTAVRDEFTNYAQKYNTPARLHNFKLSMEDIDKIAHRIRAVRIVEEYGKFKTECASLAGYMANIEYVDLGTDFREEMSAAKASFREIRDSIAGGVPGEAAAQRVSGILSKVKDRYIDLYYAEHKKKRLGIAEAKRRGQIQESASLAALRKLRGVEIVSSAKLAAIENDLSALQVCYELTPVELKAAPLCPHCRFMIGDRSRDTEGQLDQIAGRIDALTGEWTKTLLDTLSDPIVAEQKQYLSAGQREIIDRFLSAGKLPDRVEDSFISAINALLKGFEPVVIYTDDLARRLEAEAPMDKAAVNAKLAAIVEEYTKGKDAGKLRIVFKGKERG